MNEYELRLIAEHLAKIAKQLETANRIAWRRETGNLSRDVDISKAVGMQERPAGRWSL